RRPGSSTRAGAARPGGEGGGGRAVVRPSAGCSAGGPRPRRRGREARVSGAATGGQGPAAEIAAIERVVAAVEHSQNNELPAEFTRRVLPGGMRGSTVSFEVEHVLFIRPDVAAVKVRQTLRTPEGTEVGTPLFVMAEEGGRWLLTACQNTAVADEG